MAVLVSNLDKHIQNKVSLMVKDEVKVQFISLNSCDMKMARAIANQEIDMWMVAFRAEMKKMISSQQNSPNNLSTKKSVLSNESLSYNVS